MKRFYRNILIFQIVFYYFFYWFISQSARNNKELILFKVLISFFFLLSVFMSVINPNLPTKRKKTIPPEIGRKIRISWLADHCGNPNAYIGYEGIVSDVWKDGSFCIKSESSYLTISGRIKYAFVYCD